MQKDTCILMFIVALFIIAKVYKQHKCPSTDKWIKKMWYIYNGILLRHKRMKFHHLQKHEWAWWVLC